MRQVKAQDIADVMLDGIGAFYTKENPMNIKLIHIVVFQTGMVNDFKATIQHKAQRPQPGIWAKLKGSNSRSSTCRNCSCNIISSVACSTYNSNLGL